MKLISNTKLLLNARFFSKEKIHYGWVGLQPRPDSFENLVRIYKETLEEIKNFPENAVYAQVVSKLTREKLSLAEKSEVMDKIPIEHAVLQAQDELKLLRKVKEWKPWEDLEEKSPENQWKYFN
jgi:NADH dehydrogenase (ubiquinone) 1 alpha subcomplex subunit 5